MAMCNSTTCWLDKTCEHYAECQLNRIEPEDLTWFKNHYKCSCGTSWTDEWSCGCDDECPACGENISPIDSIEIGPRNPVPANSEDI